MIEWLKKERLHDKTPKQDVKSITKENNLNIAVGDLRQVGGFL